LYCSIYLICLLQSGHNGTCVGGGGGGGGTGMLVWVCVNGVPHEAQNLDPELAGVPHF